MPYVITTIGDPHEPRDRTAVATLDEARDLAAAECARQGVPYLGIKAAGDYIGPLPDGTVIEVQQVTWLELSDLAAVSVVGRFPAHDDVIAAFNSQQ